MKQAIKTALPTVLAIVLGWIAIEGLKYAQARYKAEKAAQKYRDAQVAQAAAAQTED